jgi:hypothetical protein
MLQKNRNKKYGRYTPLYFLHNKLTKTYIWIIIYIENKINKRMVMLVQDYTRMGEAAEVLKVLGIR